MVPGVGTICGYSNIDDWMSVLEVDAELVHQRVVAKKEAARSTSLVLQVTSLQDQVAIYTQRQAVLVARADKLSSDLIVLDKKYQLERVKPMWGSPVAWTVAAISTSLLAGVLVARVID